MMPKIWSFPWQIEAPAILSPVLGENKKKSKASMLRIELGGF